MGGSNWSSSSKSVKTATSTTRLVAAVALAGTFALVGVTRGEQPPFFEYAQIDPHKVVTSEKCGECHIQEAEVWKRTPHAESFKTLHRKDQAEAIAKKMGFRLIKRDSLCFSCHYTPVIDDDKIRVVSGVSCESCHGAGADYLDVHNDYGEGSDRASEPAAHRRARIENSRRAGMRRPSDLYPVAANCFSCHTVPIERLVNVGGHTTGSGSFELVEWTQGQIRHNFLESSLQGGNPVNVERPMSRKRVIYVVGRALDLEYSVRGLAKAETDGIYAKAMSRRVRSAVSELRAISRAAGISAVDDMLSAVKSVEMVPRNEAALLEAADRVQKATKSFLANPDSGRLAALDNLVRGIDPEPEDEPFEVAVEPAAGVGSGTGDGSVSEPGSPPGGSAAASGGKPSGVPSSGRSASAGSPATPAASQSGAVSPASRSSGATGAIKTRIRPASQHKTIGPGNCAGCHTEQNQWWFSHRHSKAVDPFYDNEQKNLQIARLYGVKASEMTTGRAVCMDCHGTILSGKESREVLDGVSCESCHGAAADWLEPHKNEAGKELGRKRPGHLAALAAGKLDLRSAAKRAEVCAGCHYVTEPRLLSAGHPSGADFDYVRGMNDVRHWAERLADSEIASATRAVVASRGPVPKVQIASVAASAPTPMATARAATGRAVSTSGGSAARTESQTASSSSPYQRRATETYAIRPPAPRPVVFSTGAASDSGAAGAAAVSLAGRAGPAGVELPAFPDLAGATIEQRLLALKERLNLLYGLVDPTQTQTIQAAEGAASGREESVR